MFPYLTAYGILATLGLRRDDDQRGLILAVIACALIWFMGFRFFVGCDYHSYVVRYEEYAVYDLDFVLRKGEWGFGILTMLFAKLGAPFVVFQAFITAIIVACYVRFVSKHPSPVFLLALFFPVLIMQLGMSGIRQAAALGFVLSAYNSFIAGKRVTTGLWILAGFLFHSSAIIFLPLAVIAGRQISLPRLIGGVLLLTPVAAFLLGDRVGIYADRYIDQIYGSQESMGAWIRYVLLLIPALFFLQYLPRFREAFPRAYPLLVIGALFILVLPASALVSSVALHRLGFYGMPFAALLAGYSTVLFGRNSTASRLFWIGLFAVYLLGWFTFSKHAAACFMPYQSVFFSDLIVPDWVYQYNR